jgi:hypothetical protein
VSVAGVRAALVVAAALAAPRAAAACAVCSSGREDEARIAFLWTTVFLSALPLLLAGGIALWLRRRLREHARAEADAATAPADAGPLAARR